MQVPLWEWEWDVVEDARHGKCGVSGTPYGAMEALSLALITVKGHGTGHVTPVVLVDGVAGLFYLHGAPERVARYDNGVITWKTEARLC
jgi:hypothetical protein